MKLSEMNTQQLADALVCIAGPIERIGRDEEMNRALRENAERLRVQGMNYIDIGAIVYMDRRTVSRRMEKVILPELERMLRRLGQNAEAGA